MREKAAVTSKERILLVAAEQFAEHGYRGSSMRDIAAGSGMRAASLYNHYANKEALLLAIGRRYFAAMLPALRDAAASTDQPIDRLRAMIAAASTVGSTHRFEHLTMVGEVRTFGRSPDLAELIAAGQQCRDVWHRVLKQGRRSGELRSDVSPAAATWLIFTSITGLVDPGYRADALGDRSARSVAAMTKVLIDGLRRQPDCEQA
ncbi:TetR/AcrR family transcriptional regulator [Nakamurella lactea]|jgi:AcrR family transcriptional regulator|uniref:TetR/AcrR family transcriptional regulator n=1 Tax=Nakamurella lactea TaxID=459515 RepID=UPI0003FBF6E7|nr:TetR/AcrR family transcriptional regulator [Nakamurella lactea]